MNFERRGSIQRGLNPPGHTVRSETRIASFATSPRGYIGEWGWTGHCLQSEAFIAKKAVYSDTFCHFAASCSVMHKCAFFDTNWEGTMKLGFALASFTAGICFAISAASAGQGEQNNINFLAGKDDAYLKKVATMAGDLNGVIQRCRLRPNEDGKAIITVPVLLYDGIDKHLTPNPGKFQRAIHVYERAYAMAVQRAGNCQTEKARHPNLYR
ncbi:hypothetical protein [Mesorhizobium sp. CO1-1-4]|uniref:hypothetical protein n=2 Tax=Mesorhizobium TaxID=68287 RepID=UPI001CCACEEB|nr:hypothetical protein [Mesorhizobium sp. CO1-1-4]MBZ9742133.1 hypothetical protein [Mesorhizobium sp. CO1-1-4]MBZ9804774.1 hypothetical protein [Mesorhizobium sp. ES1-6]